MMDAVIERYCKMVSSCPRGARTGDAHSRQGRCHDISWGQLQDARLCVTAMNETTG